MELERLYRYFVKQLKVKKKELKELHKNKVNALSIGEERSFQIEVIKKESELKTIQETIDFAYSYSEFATKKCANNT